MNKHILHRGSYFLLGKERLKACSWLDRMRLEMYNGQAKRDADLLWTTRTVTALLQTPIWGFSTIHNNVFWHLLSGAWGTYIFYLPLCTLSVENNWVSSSRPRLLFCSYWSKSQIFLSQAKAVVEQLALINVSYSAAPDWILGHESTLRVSVIFLNLLSQLLGS